MGNEPNDYNDCFILTANIDLDPNLPGGKVFDRAVIAPDTGTPFSGVFEGNGHVIRNLRIVSNRDYLGLFGQVDAKAEIRDLGLENVVISGAGNVIGVLAGMNLGTVTCCYSAGKVLGTNIIGGLVGQNGELVGDGVDPCIMDSYSLCAVGGRSRCGRMEGNTCHANLFLIMPIHSITSAGKDIRVLTMCKRLVIPTGDKPEACRSGGIYSNRSLHSGPEGWILFNPIGSNSPPLAAH